MYFDFCQTKLNISRNSLVIVKKHNTTKQKHIDYRYNKL